MTNKTGITGFHHVAIRAFDFEATVKFYTEVLGFKPRIAWGKETKAIMLDTGDGNYLEVFSNGPEQQKPEGSILHMAFRTEDVDGITEKARAAGAEITIEPKDVVLQRDPPTPVRISFFKGLDGEIIELFQSTGENKL